MDSIDYFQGRYRFLGNFYRHPITGAHGLRYPTAEAAFQAGKTHDPAQRALIAAAPTPRQAKELGQQVTLIPGWNEHGRHVVMRAVLAAKFTDPILADRLLATGDARLTEGNRWHDDDWGDCHCGRARCAAPGQNWLGRYLMELRATLAAARLAAGHRPDSAIRP